MNCRSVLRLVSALGLLAILAGCSTPVKVNLFETSDYIMTQPPAVVNGTETRKPGIWLSKDAVKLLQEKGALAGGF